MKNFLNSLKRIFINNKEYFIKCTLMSIISAFILGIAIIITIPASAAGEPIENNQDIIPPSTYSFNDLLIKPDFQMDEIFSFTANYSYQGVNGIVYCNGFELVEGDGFSWRIRTTFESLSDSSHQSYFENAIGVTFPFEAAIYTEYINGETTFNFSSYGFDFQNINTGAEAQSVSLNFYNWFFSNIKSSGSDDDPLLFTIEPGWYLWSEVMLESFDPHTLTFDYRTYQRVEGSGIPYYSYWSSMVFDNYTLDDSYYSQLYYSSILNGLVLVYDSTNGGWVNDIYRRFYITSPLSLSAEDYFVFLGYTEYYGDTPPTFSDEPIPSVPDPDSNILTNLIGGVLDALDAFVIFGEFSLLDMISTLLGGMALVWILKLLAGG